MRGDVQDLAVLPCGLRGGGLAVATARGAPVSSASDLRRRDDVATVALLADGEQNIRRMRRS